MGNAIFMQTTRPGVRDISQIISVRFVYTIGGNKYVNVIYVYYSCYFYSRPDTPRREASKTCLSNKIDDFTYWEKICIRLKQAITVCCSHFESFCIGCPPKRITLFTLYSLFITPFITIQLHRPFNKDRNNVLCKLQL